MKSTTVYKVTTGNRKSIISAWHKPPVSQEYKLINELTINYPTLKWAYPRINGAHLLAFKTLEAAKAFVKVEMLRKSSYCNYADGLIIWQATSDRLIEIVKHKNELPNIYTIFNYKEFLREELRVYNSNHFPSESIYCDRIRLVKKLETHYYSEDINKRAM